MDIKLSVPVTLFNYEASDNPLYSLAKLKIFYIGQTADKRLFTKKFSDELLKTLPNVPVVGYYDLEKGDFKGHNETVQHIYGHVPETTRVEYIKEEGKEFAVCDIILYTGRKDETGEIAQKIVGKSHSLELNPEDTTYTVNKDANGRIQNIEFTAGSLVGLSVLGDDQKPAFTGSEFFTVKEDNFQEILDGFKTEWEKFISRQNTQRDDGMKNQSLEAYRNFIEKSYSEKVADINKALSLKYELFFVVQVFDAECVVCVINPETWEGTYVRLSYSSENGEYSFGEPQTVLPRYLTEQEIADWEKLKNAAIVAVKEQEDNLNPGEQDDEDDGEDEEDEEDFDNSTQATVSTEGDTSHEEQGQQSTSVEQHTEQSPTGQSEEGEKTKTEPKDFSQTTLIDSERIELETFRKEKKLSIIESFSKDLNRQFLDSLIKEIEKYSAEELEIILSKEFTKVMRERQNQKPETKNNKFVPLTSYIQKTQDSNDEVLGLIEKYKSKNE